VADVNARTTLADFLAESARTPFAYGRRDCGLWMADWVKAVRGVDPAAHLRGRYRTELGCARLLRRRGGLVEVARACFESVGLVATEKPLAGDVGVIRVMTAKGEGMAGAICTGPRWAVLALGGLISAPATHVAAWRV
jgi:hypothetical protein